MCKGILAATWDINLNQRIFHIDLSFFVNIAYGTCPPASFGSGKWLTLGKLFTAAVLASSSSFLSLMINGSCGTSLSRCAAASDGSGLRLGTSPKIESASSFMEDALLARAESASSAARRSFSRRVSRPRLWQYQKTNKSTGNN